MAAGGGLAVAQSGDATAAEVKKEPTMPSGPMLQSPIDPKPAGIAAVPEPVLTSILAASAVIFLRRARR